MGVLYTLPSLKSASAWKEAIFFCPSYALSINFTMDLYRINGTYHSIMAPLRLIGIDWIQWTEGIWNGLKGVLIHRSTRNTDLSPRIIMGSCHDILQESPL